MTTNTLNRVRGHANRDAFALVEGLVVALVVGLLAAVLVVSGERARRTAMIGEDLSNLRQIGQLTGQYANDFEDKIWSFSWKKGMTPSAFPDLQQANDDSAAASNQAIDIIRRLANRNAESMPKITFWFPHYMYGHLVLMDYAGLRPPTPGTTFTANRLFVGSGDRNRLLWISDVDGFDANKFLPSQPSALIAGNRRWPYSGSYRMPHHLYSESFGPNAITNASTWSTYFIPTGFSNAAKTTMQVVFPANKVLLHEAHGRHQGKRQPYFSMGTGEARVPLLTVDGAADMRATRDGNKGWNPQNPSVALPLQYTYMPNAWDPPAVTGSSDFCYGFYDYTRSAEKGRDFGGPEVPHQP